MKKHAAFCLSGCLLLVSGLAFAAPEITWSVMHPTAIDTNYMARVAAKAVEYGGVDSFEVCGDCHGGQSGINGLSTLDRYPHAHAKVDVAAVEKNRREMNAICDIAHGIGKPLYYWHREIYIPNGLLDDLPQLMDADGEFDLLGKAYQDWLRYKLDETFRHCPGLDGIVLTLTEADYSVIHNSNPKRYPPQKVVEELVGLFAEEHEKRGKRFILRSFGSNSQDYIDIIGGAKRAAAKHGFEIETKVTEADFVPWLPKNPFLRKNPPLTLGAECDALGEYLSAGYLPAAQVARIREYVSSCREENVDRYAIRIDRVGNSIFDTAHEVNLYAYMRFIADPSATADGVLSDYAAKRFGAAAAEMVPLVKGELEMIRNIHYVASNLVFHSFPLKADFKTVKAGGIFSVYRENSSLEAAKDIWSILSWMRTPSHAQVLSEKAKGLAMAEAGLKTVESLRGRLPADEYARQHRAFAAAVTAARALQAYTRCCVAYFEDMEAKRDIPGRLQGASVAAIELINSLMKDPNDSFTGKGAAFSVVGDNLDRVYLAGLRFYCRELLTEYDFERKLRRAYEARPEVLDFVTVGGIYDDNRTIRTMHGAYTKTLPGRVMRMAGNPVFPNGTISVRFVDVPDAKVEVSLDPSGAQTYDLRETVADGFRTVSVGKKGRGYPAVLGIALVRRSPAVLSPAPEKAEVIVTPDRITAVYAAGEQANLSIEIVGTNGLALTKGKVRLAVDNFGTRIVQPERVVDLAAENPIALSLTKESPGFLRIRLAAADTNELQIVGNRGQAVGVSVYGVGFSPERIVPGTPNPDDFDAFWKRAIADMDATVPADPRLEEVPGMSTADRVCYRVSFATVGDRRVFGWLSEPRDLSKGPFPVRLNVPGAGVGACGTGGDAQTISLTMNVHSYAQPEGSGPEAVRARKTAYDAQDERYAKPCGVARYCQAGIHLGRERYFYYASILGINRAVNWLAARPECDLGDFTYSGTSQGGGFGLILTALNPHITRSCIFVPALTDLLGYKVEDRQSGWPQLIEAQLPENRAAAEQAAPYFCGVNFARRIRVPIRFVVGFSDTVCSPNAVYSAYNVCPSADKGIFNGIQMGHGVYPDFYTYLRAWQQDSGKMKSDYRMLAFNIWGDFFNNPPPERDTREGELVRRWNPDFAAFQEMTPRFWDSEIFTPLKKDYEVIGRGMGPLGVNASNPLAFRKDRFELVEKGSKWFCEELDQSKGVVWAVVRDRANGQRFVVFSSHYWWQNRGASDRWVRLQNSKILFATLFDLAKRHDAAVVGGGDLNSPCDSAAMRYLVEKGLWDAQETAKVSPRGFLTDHYNPFRDARGVYHGIPAIRGMTRRLASLDHVFYDPNRIVMNRFDLDLSPEACSLSDHHPIVADFSLAGSDAR